MLHAWTLQIASEIIRPFDHNVIEIRLPYSRLVPLDLSHRIASWKDLEQHMFCVHTLFNHVQGFPCRFSFFIVGWVGLVSLGLNLFSGFSQWISCPVFRWFLSHVLVVCHGLSLLGVWLAACMKIMKEQLRPSLEWPRLCLDEWLTSGRCDWYDMN